MRVLPPTVELPRERISRRHAPKRKPYQRYRECLAWDFGFFCAFCFLHEADLSEHGFSALGAMWIEHYHPQSRRPSQRDRYANCFYSCRYCNRSRGDLKVRRADGAVLLNPCSVVWSEYFKMAGTQMLPVMDSATYTFKAYDLNDPVKVTMRESRGIALVDGWAIFDGARKMRDRILDELTHLPKSEHPVLLEELELYDLALRRAIAQIERYAVVPHWARSARCECTADCEPPAFIVPQLVDGPAQ